MAVECFGRPMSFLPPPRRFSYCRRLLSVELFSKQLKVMNEFNENFQKYDMGQGSDNYFLVMGNDLVFCLALIYRNDSLETVWSPLIIWGTSSSTPFEKLHCDRLINQSVSQSHDSYSNKDLNPHNRSLPCPIFLPLNKLLEDSVRENKILNCQQA